MTKDEFESIYTHTDSTKTQLWECGSPFEWLDEKWMVKAYGEKDKGTGIFKNFNGEITNIYSQNIDFTTNNHIVLFDTGFAANNSFKIIYLVFLYNSLHSPTHEVGRVARSLQITCKVICILMQPL